MTVVSIGIPGNYPCCKISKRNVGSYVLTKPPEKKTNNPGLPELQVIRDEPVLLYQISFFIIGISYIVFYFVFRTLNPTLYEPFFFRVLIAGLTLGIVIASYFITFIKNQLQNILYVLSWLIILHFLYLGILVNPFSLEYLASAFIFIFISDVFLLQRGLLLTHKVFSVLVLTLIIILFPDFPVNKILAFILLLVLYAFNTFVLLRIIRTRKKLESSQTFLYTLYAELGDALVLLDLTSRTIIDMNATAHRWLGIPPTSDLRSLSITRDPVSFS
jgi:hypothetical protein